MRLLLVGAWQYVMYEKACADALARLGVTVIPFTWARYFRGLIGRAQHKYPFPGPAMLQLNRDVVRRARELQPDCVFVWRGTHLRPKTLRTIKEQTGAFCVSYNNDDPFSPQYPRFVWHNYLQCLPEFDMHFVYRPVNKPEMQKAGARNVHLLMPYFVPEWHRPVTLDGQEETRYRCDVVFVGHYEPDGRERYLKTLLDAGLHVRLFGGDTWKRATLRDVKERLFPVRPVMGDEYAKALCGATMCLCFLSRLNRDEYTRRCFEIPACGRLLLSERTPALTRLFKENEEAVFFSNEVELREKALWLRDHPEEVHRIATAGMRRVHAEGHSVDHRMNEFLHRISELQR